MKYAVVGLLWLISGAAWIAAMVGVSYVWKDEWQFWRLLGRKPTLNSLVKQMKPPKRKAPEAADLREGQST